VNKKLWLIVGVILLFLLTSFLYLSVYGIQNVSTDKYTYYNYPRLENKVKITYSSFDIFYQACIDNYYLVIYKKEGEAWVNVNYNLIYPSITDFQGCLNDAVTFRSYCDVAYFKWFNRDFRQFVWDTNYYEAQGIINQCGDIPGTFTHYVLKKAPAGTYKIVYGGAEKEFVLTSEMRGI